MLCVVQKWRSLCSQLPEKRSDKLSRGYFLADALAEETGYEDLDGIVLPGGMPGTMHLLENETVNAVIRKFAEEGKWLLRSVQLRVC